MKTIDAASFKDRILDIVEKEIDALSRRRDEERCETPLKPTDLSLLKYAHRLASEVEEQEAESSGDEKIKDEKIKKQAKHTNLESSPLAKFIPAAGLSAPAPLLPEIMDPVRPDVVRKVDDALRKQGIDPALDDLGPPNHDKAVPIVLALRRR